MNIKACKLYLVDAPNVSMHLSANELSKGPARVYSVKQVDQFGCSLSELLGWGRGQACLRLMDCTIHQTGDLFLEMENSLVLKHVKCN